MKKNQGIELLRIISMIYVMILHCMGKGGVLANATDRNVLYYSAWFLQVLAYPAVDIFAIISGYVSYKDQAADDTYKKQYIKWVYMWAQVVFFGLISTIIYGLVNPERVEKRDLLVAFLPVNKNIHWYFTAFTGVVILKPILDEGIKRIKSAKAFLIVGFIFFVAFDCLSNIFNMNDGYSLIWICILYITGGLIKKEKIEKRISKWLMAVLIAFLYLCTWLWKVLYGILFTIPLSVDSNFFINKYNSPTIVLISVFYVMLFARLNIPNCFHKEISFFSKNSFSAYILNTNRFFYGYILADLFVKPISIMHSYVVILIVIFSILFFIFSVLIDKLRVILFKILQINKLIDYCMKKVLGMTTD